MRVSVPIFCCLQLLGAGAVIGQPAIRMVTDQADAALAILEARQSGLAPSEAQWQALFDSEGYRRLSAREAAMGRAFSDSAFAAFLGKNSLAPHAAALRQTVDAWERADLIGAYERATRYLPRGTIIGGSVYLLIKPQPNSFVFEPRTNPAIMLFVDPAVSRDKLENTIAHELHHLGYAQACPPVTADLSTPAGRLAPWLGAFGEGVAMLAAAGDPNIHPHRASDSSERAAWDADLRNIGTAFADLERFFLDVLDERIVDPDSIRTAAMGFFGVQGPWYTVGWLMARTIEIAYGRAAVVSALCQPANLLREYERAATSDRGPALPRWSSTVISRLPGNG